MSEEDASAESGNRVDAPRDRAEIAEIEMVIAEVGAVIAEGEAVAGREANISEKDSGARRGGNVDSVEARAKDTRTSARVRETRSSEGDDPATPTMLYEALRSITHCPDYG